ncbi:pilus assembly protein TadG-related protein [Streptomyces sp. NPDC127049]|uniref:pilus assembly protein TadG-related protein n=1 Tax=Streptomyces sp. NPDC127049 TaxID=3347118 RepID=UPI00365DA865
MAALRSDCGQAFPAYVAVVAALLFLGLVFFVVGRAAVVRNGAQTAADAAALAATQSVRDQLREDWLGVIDDPAQWQQFVEGNAEVDTRLACQKASDFAANNGAEVDECVQTSFGFRVGVRTADTVGESIVPDTEAQRAVAAAAAVIEPRCSFDAPEPTTEPELPEEPEPTDDPEPTPSPEPAETPEMVTGLVCDGEPVSIDPLDPVLPSAGDLFHVRLTGDDE